MTSWCLTWLKKIYNTRNGNIVCMNVVLHDGIFLWKCHHQKTNWKFYSGSVRSFASIYCSKFGNNFVFDNILGAHVNSFVFQTEYFPNSLPSNESFIHSFISDRTRVHAWECRSRYRVQHWVGLCSRQLRRNRFWCWAAKQKKKMLRIRYAKTCAWYESSVHGKEINKIITMQVMLVSATDSACRHWSGAAAWWMRNVVIHVALPLCRSTKWGQAKSTWNKPYKYQTDNHHRRMWTRFRAQSHYLFQSLA